MGALDETTKIVGLSIYSPDGIWVGNVDNIVFDLRSRKIDGIFSRNTNPTLVEKGVAVNIPYRWVQSVGDVIILKVFPEKVTIDPKDASRSLPKS
jgi:Uncharacterized conserved protein